LKILLVRLREIGDVVFTTPIVHAIRRRFREFFGKCAAAAQTESQAVVQELDCLGVLMERALLFAG